MGESSHVKTYRARHLGSRTIRASAEGYIGKMMGSGKDTQHHGALIITDTEVIFYRKGFFGEVNQSIPLKSVTSIEQKSTFGHRNIRIHTSHDDLSFSTLVDKEAYRAVLAALESGRSGSPAPSANPLEALRQLGESRAAGVISEADFESKKAALLARV